MAFNTSVLWIYRHYNVHLIHFVKLFSKSCSSVVEVQPEYDFNMFLVRCFAIDLSIPQVDDMFRDFPDSFVTFCLI